MRGSRSQAVLGGLLLTSVVVLGGCGEDEEPAGPGGPGVAASVGDMELRNVRLDNPPDGIYEIGSAALLGVAMVNSGDEDDELVGVSGPDFTGTVVDEDPASSDPGISIPEGETVFTDGPDGPVLVIVGLDETLRTAESLEITFTFQEAGEVTVDAPVSAPLRLTLDRFLREQASGD
ncbi:copper chaperone PCu(A)C [Candidatus Blastococcus massiliensis]|uniref:copper chaperone PCu(A)C n=1 Tax=Candidatus Blastococcus massiliensis TaxID=1470358 RepID=UPI0004BB7F4A|nr:copper chaperone PCu(A)C [Candidatus Blastococcus massiliensis]